jgi:DNA-binding MarR family transcriptional regulator
VRDGGVRAVLEQYPKIFFACHTRHRQDPATRRRLSAHQGSILDHLDDVQATSVNGLARHMGVTASTMSLSIDRLERGGFVRRERDMRDGRRVLLRLTPAGARVKRAQSVLEPQRVGGMLAQLPQRKKAAALRGLALLADAAQKFMEKSPKTMVGLGRQR